MTDSPAAGFKLDVLIVHFAYAGNGGCASEQPPIRQWAVETHLKAAKDPRIGRVGSVTLSDTPITMTRNRAVKLAKEGGFHLLMMVDSDQNPQRHEGEPWYRPFWDVALDEIYAHYHKGPLCLFAPYCGPPPGENVYVFQWDSDGVYGDETPPRLEQYTRAQAKNMRGVHTAAAGPTGFMLTDVRCFDIVKPSDKPRKFILEDLAAGKITPKQAERMLHEGWFYYEWKDCTASEKASTEDVSFTRDLVLACMAKHGYNPLRCCWDSWVGHLKPWDVGKPIGFTEENVGSAFKNAILNEDSAYDATVDVGHLIGSLEKKLARGELSLPVLKQGANGKH